MGSTMAAQIGVRKGGWIQKGSFRVQYSRNQNTQESQQKQEGTYQVRSGRTFV